MLTKCVTDDELLVYGCDIEEIARHRLLPRGVARERQVCPEHRPAEDSRRQQELLRQSFVELGAIGARFYDKLLEAHRQGRAQARRILALRAHYHQADLVAALERAARYGAFSSQAIERILHVQAQLDPPRFPPPVKSPVDSRNSSPDSPRQATD